MAKIGSIFEIPKEKGSQRACQAVGSHNCFVRALELLVLGTQLGYVFV